MTQPKYVCVQISMMCVVWALPLEERRLLWVTSIPQPRAQMSGLYSPNSPFQMSASPGPSPRQVQAPAQPVQAPRLLGPHS